MFVNLISPFRTYLSPHGCEGQGAFLGTKEIRPQAL